MRTWNKQFRVNNFLSVFLASYGFVMLPGMVFATSNGRDSTAMDSLITTGLVMGAYHNTYANLPYFVRSERELKIRLMQVARFAGNKSISYQQPMDEFAREFDTFPDETKNRILVYTAAGAAGMYGLRAVRRFLSRHKMLYIVPSLHGLCYNQKIPPLNLQMRFLLRPDVSYNVDTYFWLWNFHYHFQEQSLARSNYLFLKLSNHFRFLLSHQKYHHKFTSNGAGMLFSQPNLFFLFRIEELTWLDHMLRFTFEFRLNTY